MAGKHRGARQAGRGRCKKGETVPDGNGPFDPDDRPEKGADHQESMSSDGSPGPDVGTEKRDGHSRSQQASNEAGHEKRCNTHREDEA
jgi:hypothetical protein